MSAQPSPRLIRAYRVADIPPGAESAPWSPPALTPGRLPPPLEMRLPTEVETAEAVEGPKEAPSPPPEAKEPPPAPAPQPESAPTSPELSIPIGRIEAQSPEDVARVIRTLLIEEGRAEGKDLSGRQKAAILAITLGQSATARVVKHLNDYEIEDIAQAISELKTVTSEQEREVVEEIEQLLVAGHYVSMGGIDFARGALEKALGPQRAQQMLDRVTASTTVGFYLLKNIAPNHLAPFIGKEHPQTIALVLSQLEPAQAAGVLNILPDELASEVTYRVATMENISPQVLREIEESLAMELQAILTGQITDIGGVKKVAEILNVTGPTTEKVILEKLDERDPEMAEEIRNEMFTFDDIARLTDREIQRLLREVDKKDLAVSLKGARPEMQDRILSNVSEEVRAQVKELMEFSGPIRLSDVEEVQLRIVQMVRQLEEAGQVTVVRGESKDVFV